MPVVVEDLDQVIAEINKRYEGDLRLGDTYEHPARVSTGSIELDAAMGGGVPMGRWTRFYGGYSSTKTLTALSVIREAQAQGLICAYYNAEKQYDPEFAQEKIGVDTSALHIVEGSSIEEIGEKMEALLGVIHVHVIDSTSVAESEDALDVEVRDWRPGINARAWGKVFRRVNNHFDHQENTAILIDQVRVNFKTGGEDPAGGKIMDHQSSMSVRFRKDKWLYRNPDGFLDEKAKQEKGPDDQTVPSGYTVKIRVEKSRVGRPFLTATRRLDLDNLEFDSVFELEKMGRHFGIIKTTGKGRYEYGKAKFHGSPQLRDFIRGSATLQEEIWDTTMKLAHR